MTSDDGAHEPAGTTAPDPDVTSHAAATQASEPSTTTSPPIPSTMTGLPTIAESAPTPPPPSTSHGNPFGDDHAVNSAPTPALPPRPQEDPRITNLKGMFPDFDTETLQAILQSVNWDEARAIDTLLGMSDPDFRPQEQPTAPRSQTDLDEEFARRLMLEEQQQHEAAWAAQQGDGEHTWQAAQPAQGQQWQRREDRRRRDSYDDGAWERPERQAGQGDFAEIQEQFSKIAETGKKTFNSLFNKVKAKINEYDTGRPGQGSGQDAAPNWGTAGTDQQYQPPAQPPAGQQSYYAPSSASPPSAPVHGYDLGPGSPPRSGVAPSSAPGAKLGPGSPPRSVSSPSNDASRPPTSTGPPTSSIDPTKIGLLPKKPVSLLRDPQSQRQPTEDDDDMYASPEEPDANTAKPSTHDA